MGQAKKDGDRGRRWVGSESFEVWARGLARNPVNTVWVDDTEPFVWRLRNTTEAILAMAVGQGGTDHSDRKGLTALYRRRSG